MTDPETSFEQPAQPSVSEPAPAEPRPSAAASAFAALREIVEVLVLAVLMVMLIRNFVQNYRIDGISMEPNFHNGQFLIVNRYAYCPGIHIEVPLVNIPVWEKTWCTRLPRRGDVIIFEYPRDPSRDFIKRVIGLPGETVEIVDGKVYIDGQLMPEPFGPNPGSYTAGPLTVGPNEVYVMGEERTNTSCWVTIATTPATRTSGARCPWITSSAKR